MTSSLWPEKASRIARVASWCAAILLALVVVMSAWVGVRGALAYYHLAQMREAANAATSSLATDPGAALVILERMGSETEQANELTSDPVWKAFEGVPWAGPQLNAFRVLAESADQLVRDSLLPLATAAQGSSIDSLKPVNGRIDTASLKLLAEPAEKAARSAAVSSRQVQNVDRLPLLEVVSRGVDQADDLFSRTSTALDALSRATAVLPSMLGEQGERNYLLLVQNNAEWRSLGGITGTAILLRTNQGSVSIAETRSATSIYRDSSGPIVNLPEEVQRIYETRPARYFHNLTQIPDFTVDGPLAREMYESQTGVSVDGVLAIDPVVLSYLLKATGPVTLATGAEMTTQNAAATLMSDVYAQYPDPRDQDLFFASATGEVFDAFLSGKGSTSGMLSALARAADERRVLIWSARPEEQSLLEGSTLAGELPETDERTARFGVFLNDATGSKMSYYVSPRVTLAWSGCPDTAQPVRQLSLEVHLESSAPADAASALPTYVTGNGVYGVAPGTASTVTNIYLPAGYELANAASSDGATYTSAQYQGRTVLTFGSSLPPGGSINISVSVTVVTGAVEAEAFATPTADANLAPVTAARCVASRGAGLR